MSRRTFASNTASRAREIGLLALDRISLSVNEGEFVSIVGPSGCGKTTFLSVVDGLLPATSGQIIVDGLNVTKPGPDRAVVFQDASLLPWRTVLKNVCYGLECIGVERIGNTGPGHEVHPHGRARGLREQLPL